MRALLSLILFCSFFKLNAQSCSEWLELSAINGFAYFSGINIGSTKLTVEAKFISRSPLPAGQSDNLVSKFHDPTATLDFVLRPNGAEITTVNGHFKTPEVCEIVQNKVYHVAFVYDGSSLKFYRNGYLMSQVAARGNLVSNLTAVLIGHNDRISPNNFFGFIDEVRVWDYARPQELIKTYMNMTLPTPAAQVGLVAYFTFEDRRNAQGDNIHDLTLTFEGAELNVIPTNCLFTPDSCSIYIPAPDSIVITNNVTMCAGSHHQIKTHPADSYIWTPTTYLDDPTSPLPTATPPVSTTYYVEAYIAATNKIIHDSVRITVVRSDIKANEDTTVCAGSPVQMKVTHGTSFIWSPVAGLSDPQVPDPVARPVTTTKYIVTGIGESRCASSDTVIITVLPAPNAVVSNDTVVCKSATVQLSASGGVSYEWFPSSQLNDANIADPLATTQSTTLYSVNVKGVNGCVTTDTVNVVVRTYPEFTTSGNQTVCEGEQAELSASGGTRYQWQPAAQVSDAKAATTYAILSGASTTYTVHISEEVCNYDTTMSMTIVQHPNPVISILKSNDINCTNPTTLLEAKGANSYYWTPSIYVDNATSAKPIVFNDTTTTFTVTGSTDAGCTSTASVTVKVDNSGVPRFVLPNAFTPNGDGRNDCFGIRRWGNANIQQFAIYNRWGQAVFQTNDPADCWDGAVGGVPQAAGTYIFIINATTLCGPVKRRGMMTLIR